MSGKKPQKNEDNKEKEKCSSSSKSSPSPTPSQTTPSFPPKLLEPPPTGCKESEKPSCPVTEAIDRTASNTTPTVSESKSSSQNESLKKLGQRSTTSSRKSRNSNGIQPRGSNSKRSSSKLPILKSKENQAGIGSRKRVLVTGN